jgi:hypothetical protein
MKCENHKKVYANYILTSNPPQYPWICSECGEKGTDRKDYYDGPSYDEIYKKFYK